MKRGEIWTATGAGYGSKPRLVIIIQDDQYNKSTLESVLVIPLTTHTTDAPITRPLVAATSGTGINLDSYMMVDKALPIRKTNIKNLVGNISNDEMKRIEQSILVLFGIASGTRSTTNDTDTEPTREDAPNPESPGLVG